MTETPEPLGVLIGTLPYMAGYALTRRHVAMVGIGSDGVVGPVGMTDWAEAEERGLSSMAVAEDCAAAFGRAIRGTEYRRVVLIGYGEQGASRTAALEDALLGTLDLPDPIQVHVEGTSYRVLSADGWTSSAPVPDVSAAAVFAGAPPPARSRDELQQRFAPLASPLFGELDAANVDALSAAAPSLRAEIAKRTLELLAAVGDDDPQQAATVAYLATSDETALDQLVYSAAQDAALKDALVRTFRAAPEHLRPSLAAASAAATWLAGDNTPYVEALSHHADGATGAARKLNDLVQLGLQETVPPGRVLDQWATTLPRQIADADQRWQTARDLGMPPDLAARLLERSQQIDDPPAQSRAPTLPPDGDHPPTPTVEGPQI